MVGQLNVVFLKHKDGADAVLALPDRELRKFLLARPSKAAGAFLFAVVIERVDDLNPTGLRRQILEAETPDGEGHIRYGDPPDIADVVGVAAPS